MCGTMKVHSKIQDYEVTFVESLDEIIDEINKPNTITFIDHNVASLYPKLNCNTNIIIIECTEDSKTLSGAVGVFSELVERKANIKTKLIVIGGGILQDVVGFCASVYCRGIEYILVPTTLLSQVDSCVGGKTSINFQNRKNILGTFYPPSRILINTDFIKTLSTLDYISGLGEIYKFHILQNKMNEFDADGDIQKMVCDGLMYKIQILSRDEFDHGDRKFLNFGHSFGHALESISGNEIPHGIAVILGSMTAVAITKELGYGVKDYNHTIATGVSLIKRADIKLKREWFDWNIILQIIKSDKKSTGKLTMVLVDTKPFLMEIEDLDIIQPILTKVYNESI